MRQPDLTREGYQPVLEPMSKFSRIVNETHYLMKTRDPRKRERLMELDAALDRAVREPGGEQLDFSEAKKLPPFEMAGFEGYPPDEYRPGEKRATAPMSKEQMQILLSSTIPAEMLPFVLESCQFVYEPNEENNPYTGPSAKVVTDPETGKKKLQVTLTNQHFYSKGVPPSLVTQADLSKAQVLFGPHSPLHDNTLTNNIAAKIAQRRHGIAGFIDPSKVTLLLGKVFAHAIIDPINHKDNKDLKEWGTVVDKDFHLTDPRFDKKKQRRRPDLFQRLKKSERTKKDQEKLFAQWQDFVGMAFIAPDIAKRRMPEAYAYFEKKIDQFNTPEFDEKAFDHLRDAANKQGGVIRLHDIVTTPDLRTPEEKAEDKGISPELAGYERFIAGFNRASAAFGRIPLFGKLPFVGLQLTYTIPDMPESLAEDEKEAKRLAENLPDEKIRDEDFMQLLAGADGNNPKHRSEAFQYLLAASQTKNYAEWRVYAWLYKFSPTFRQWHGQYVGEDDYKALQILHDQSEKSGRVGTGVMPYEAVQVRARDAQHVGRKHGTFLYVRKDRAKYVKQVEKKIRDHSISALSAAMDANKYKTLEQLQQPGGGWFGLDEKFSETAGGGLTPTVDIAAMGGEKFGPELVKLLGDLGIDKASPDARAAAVYFYEYYRERNLDTDRFITSKIRNIISEYGEQLNQPPEDTIEKLLDTSAKQLAEMGDFTKIMEKDDEAKKAKNTIMTSLGAELRKDQYSEYITNEVRTQILYLIEQGAADAKTLTHQIYPMLLHLYNDKQDYHRETIQHRLNLITRFMYDPKTIRNLMLLEKVQKFEHDLRPGYAVSIEKAAKEVTTAFVDKDGNPDPERVRNVIVPEKLKHKDLENYKKRGIQLTPEEVEEIRQANQSIPTEAAPAAVPGETAQPAVNTDVDEDSTAKMIKRSQIVARKLVDKKTDPLIREMFVTQNLEDALVNIETAIFYQDGDDKTKTVEAAKNDDEDVKDKTASTIQDRFSRWFTGGDSDSGGAPDSKIFTLPALRPAYNTLAFYAAQASSSDPVVQAAGLQHLGSTLADLKKSVNFEKKRLEHETNPKTAKAKETPKEDEDH